MTELEAPNLWSVVRKKKWLFPPIHRRRPQPLRSPDLAEVVVGQSS